MKIDETFDVRLMIFGLYETLAIKQRTILTSEKIILYADLAIICHIHKFKYINRIGSDYWLSEE